MQGFDKLQEEILKGAVILRGIPSGTIWVPTDVYKVRLPLPAGTETLLLGQVLEGMSPRMRRLRGSRTIR